MKSRALHLSNAPEQEGLGIAISVLLHVLVVVVIVMWQHFHTSKYNVFIPNYQTVSLLGSAPVTQAPAPSAPSKPAPPAASTKPAAPPATAKPDPIKPAAEPIKPNKPEAQKPMADSSRQLDQQLRQMQAETEAARRAQEEAARRAEEQRRATEAERELQNRINAMQQRQGASGTAATAAQAGGAPSEIDPREQAYLQQLWERIRQNWALTLVQNSAGLETIIALRLKPDGSLDQLWIDKSSGNSQFDNTALRAAEKSAPFGAPPFANAGAYFEAGIRFRDESR